MTARMGVSVGRLPQDVLLEEFYRSESSETRTDMYDYYDYLSGVRLDL
jgi:hypothetical protein